jgi:hypothetical protein
MNKIILDSIELIIAIGLAYLLFRYWNSKLRKGYSLEKTNKSYALFLVMQVLTLLIVIIQGIDPQNAIYLEGLSMFGEGGYQYWSIVGVQLAGFSVIFVLANLLGHILFSAGYKSEQGLYDEVKADNWPVVMIASALIFMFGYIAAHFVLKPFIFDWVSHNAVFIPLT